MAEKKYTDTPHRDYYTLKQAAIELNQYFNRHDLNEDYLIHLGTAEKIAVYCYTQEKINMVCSESGPLGIHPDTVELLNTYLNENKGCFSKVNPECLAEIEMFGHSKFYQCADIFVRSDYIPNGRPRDRKAEKNQPEDFRYYLEDERHIYKYKKGQYIPFIEVIAELIIDPKEPDIDYMLMEVVPFIYFELSQQNQPRALTQQFDEQVGELKADFSQGYGEINWTIDQESSYQGWTDHESDIVPRPSSNEILLDYALHSSDGCQPDSKVRLNQQARSELFIFADHLEAIKNNNFIVAAENLLPSERTFTRSMKPIMKKKPPVKISHQYLFINQALAMAMAEKLIAQDEEKILSTSTLCDAVREKLDPWLSDDESMPGENKDFKEWIRTVINRHPYLSKSGVRPTKK